MRKNGVLVRTVSGSADDDRSPVLSIARHAQHTSRAQTCLEQKTKEASSDAVLGGRRARHMRDHASGFVPVDRIVDNWLVDTWSNEQSPSSTHRTKRIRRPSDSSVVARLLDQTSGHRSRAWGAITITLLFPPPPLLAVTDRTATMRALATQPRPHLQRNPQPAHSDPQKPAAAGRLQPQPVRLWFAPARPRRIGGAAAHLAGSDRGYDAKGQT